MDEVGAGALTGVGRLRSVGHFRCFFLGKTGQVIFGFVNLHANWLLFSGACVISCIPTKVGCSSGRIQGMLQTRPLTPDSRTKNLVTDIWCSRTRAQPKF